MWKESVISPLVLATALFMMGGSLWAGTGDPHLVAGGSNALAARQNVPATPFAGEVQGNVTQECNFPPGAIGPGAPEKRHGLSMVQLPEPDGRVILFGGEGDQGELFNDLHMSGDGNGWNEVVPTNDPPPPRRDHTAWMASCDMMVYGGYGADGPLGDMWKYSITDNTWSQVPINETSPHPSPRYGQSTTTLPDGSTLILGGVDLAGHELGDFWKYSPSSGTFQQLPSSPTVCSYHEAHYVVDPSTGEKVLWAFCKPEVLNMYMFDSGAWNLASIPNGNWPKHTGSVMVQNAGGTDSIYFIGGEDTLGNESDSIYEFDTATGELTKREERLPYSVKDHGLVPRGVGPSQRVQTAQPVDPLTRVLIFGGISNGEPVSTTLTITIGGYRTYLPLVRH